MFETYNYLGFNNPYFFVQNEKIVVFDRLSDLAFRFPNDLHIDPVAIVELLNKSYVLGDRTLIEGISKSPWMARPSVTLDSWENYEVPSHGTDIHEEEVVARNLFNLVCDEICLYVGNKSKIGLLLSGGMDSRIVAGALDYLIKSGKVSLTQVTALTWGDDDSRDVVYAQEISRRLGWNWKHYRVTGKHLLDNLKETVERGCEYSPIHLHALPQIRDDNDLEVILAGSFGDSIGRAEYSGKKVKNIRPIINNIVNVGSIVIPDVFKEALPKVQRDVNAYHSKFPRKDLWMQHELDYQLHYMRRMLNPCMDVLNNRSQIRQVFTHPSVYGYMWSLNPECRTDGVYKRILGLLSTKLDDIPWARTGLPYGVSKGIPDSYKRSHHSYASIIQKDILADLEKLILSPELKALGVFNFGALKTLIFLIKKFPISHIKYAEKIIWIASVALMVRTYKIQPSSVKIQESKAETLSVVSEYMKNYLKYTVGGTLSRWKILR